MTTTQTTASPDGPITWSDAAGWQWAGQSYASRPDAVMAKFLATTTDGSWVDMDGIRGLYSPGEGRHWFDADTMRFFYSRLAQGGRKVSDGILFISSEQCKMPYYAPHSPRRYTVRKLTAKRQIETVTEFNTLTRSQADTALRGMLKAA